jgi:hypothetical protein
MVWCGVSECGREAWITEGHDPSTGRSATRKKYILIFPKFLAVALCVISKNKKMHVQIRDEFVMLLYYYLLP